MCRPTFFLTAPYQTPKDELFQRATSFQDDYRAELQTLLTTYNEELLGIAGASGVKAPRRQ